MSPMILKRNPYLSYVHLQGVWYTGWKTEFCNVCFPFIFIVCFEILNWFFKLINREQTNVSFNSIIDIKIIKMITETEAKSIIVLLWYHTIISEDHLCQFSDWYLEPCCRNAQKSQPANSVFHPVQVNWIFPTENSNSDSMLEWMILPSYNLFFRLKFTTVIEHFPH